MTDLRCDGYGDQVAPHDLPATEENFAKWAREAPDGKPRRCRDCDKLWRRDHKRDRKGGPDLSKLRFSEAGSERISDEEAQRSHEYIPNPELVALFATVVSNTLERGAPPANLVFFGPSGSGKTDGAAFLAASVGLPFTKVDAASMTDPESWFGTREVDVEDGASVTRYIPSDFVHAVQAPGVVFIDEVNRVDDEHRNVLLPLTDGTGRVTNPLTGELVVRHPHCFIIMAGNRGLQFTGTSAIDPAFTTRALTVEFDYIGEADERRVTMEAAGCDADTAAVFVRFAGETRQKAAVDPDFTPISTREVISAARLVAGGLSRDLAAKFAIINSASNEGGTASTRTELEAIWAGVRLTKAEADSAMASPSSDWICPDHGQVKTVPAGVSQKTGKPYNAFKACPVAGCGNTEDRRAQKPAAPGQLACPDCGAAQPAGRQTFCVRCGATLS